MDGPTGTLTFLLTDIEGSTRNWDASETEMRRALGRHDAILAEIIAAHDGHVLTERGEGDSFFAIFAVPSDAVAAAVNVQRALADEPWPDLAPVRVRVAIHTGEAGPDHRGPEVNRCARLRAIAHGGQVLLSAPTADLVRGRLPAHASLVDLGMHRLRDLTIPERIYQLAHPDIPASFGPLATLDTLPNNLPVQTTSFIGRTAELATVIDLVRAHRLVTLTGAGGAGKTRLALQAGAELLEAFADGVWFVDLAPIADPDLVAATVAASASVAEVPGRALIETLPEHLVARRTLFIVDNCEHLVGAVADLVDRILRRAPEVRVLATSREALNVPGEFVWRVPSLAPIESAQLFVDRALALEPRFVLTDASAEAIAGICRRLDGVPLAIELAAARIRILAPDELLRRLEDRFRLLTGGSRTALPRQQTLRATVDWSYELLGVPERVLFRRASVFAGGFDLAACEAVCADADQVPGSDVLDLLAQLVDKSLVMAEPDQEGAIRYQLLETLREYGHARLEEAGEAAIVADAHLRHFLSIAETARRERWDAGIEWLPRLERDVENFRSAMDHARATDPDIELVLAGTLAWFWTVHTVHASEGRRRLAHVLEGREGERSVAVARALTGAAMTANWAGSSVEAAGRAERAIVLWQQLGDALEEGLAYEALGWARLFSGDTTGALRPMEQGVACMLRTSDDRLVNRLKVDLGQVLVALGDVEAVEPLAQETLHFGYEHHALREIHYSLHYLGDCALYRENGAEAARWYRQSLAAALDYGNVAEAAVEMEGLAMALAAQGDAEGALRLQGAAAAQMTVTGFDASGVEFWGRLKDRYLAPARAKLGEQGATAADAAGRTMGWEAAVRSAQDPSGPRIASTSAD